MDGRIKPDIMGPGDPVGEWVCASCKKQPDGGRDISIMFLFENKNLR